MIGAYCSNTRCILCKGLRKSPPFVDFWLTLILISGSARDSDGEECEENDKRLL